MKFLAVILLVAVIAHSEVYGNSLECYQCSGDGCNSDAIETVNCYDEVPTTAAPSTTTTTAGPTTSPPDSTPTSTTVSTTASTPSSTVSSTIESSSTVTSTAGTTPTTEAPSSTTQAPPSTTTQAPPSTTTQAPPSTTQASSSPTEASSSTTVATGGLSQRYMKELSRRRRAADDTYKCYTMKYNDNGTTKTQKGCTKIVEGKDSCSEVVTPANTSLESCEVCAEDKCNSSSAIQLSILAIVAALYVRFVM